MTTLFKSNDREGRTNIGYPPQVHRQINNVSDRRFEKGREMDSKRNHQSVTIN